MTFEPAFFKAAEGYFARMSERACNLANASAQAERLSIPVCFCSACAEGNTDTNCDLKSASLTSKVRANFVSAAAIPGPRFFSLEETPAR